MRDALPLLLLLIVAPFATGCQSSTPQSPSTAQDNTPTPPATSDTPAAYLDGKVVTQGQLYRLMIQAHGGEALAETLLDRSVQARLEQEAIELTPADLDAEKDKLLSSLSPDADQAARLLSEMRSQRGLDDARFEALLRRNAGLRRLVRDQITISDTAIAQAYALRHGKRYRVRLIVTEKLDTLTDTRKKVLAGASFTNLAIERSTDRSANQGGLLSPISPADATYPKAIRDALPKLSMDNPNTRLSPAIALDAGYALLWLEQVVLPDNAPNLAEARPELLIVVRRNLERIRMRQLARTLIEQADVVILDPALNKAWQQQQNTINSPQSLQ